MVDIKADPAVLQAWASRLRSGSDELDSGAQGAPEAPNAGRSTGVVAAGLTQLSDAMAVLTEGVDIAGQAVASGSIEYDERDQGASDNLKQQGGN